MNHCKLRNIKNRSHRKISSRKLKKQRRGGKLYIGSRKKPKYSKNNKREILVLAPAGLDLYTEKRHRKMMLFLSNMRESVKYASATDSIVKVCFRNSSVITAAAGILLLAKTESLKAEFPKVKFRVTHPPKSPNGETHRADYVVHAVLNRIGFYEAIGVKAFKTKKLPHVNNWQVSSATKVEGDIVGQAIEKLNALGIAENILYRSGIEAVSNAAEHGYSDKIPIDRHFPLRKWWLFTGVIDHNLIVVVCDLGYGIPVTLPHTQSSELLDRVKKKLKSYYSNLSKSSKFLVDDVAQIHAATLVKETGTELGYRGKGGQDIKSLIDTYVGSSLGIFSNHGRYMYRNIVGKRKKATSLGYNNRESIGGTIIEWSVPISTDVLEAYNETYSES